MVAAKANVRLLKCGQWPAERKRVWTSSASTAACWCRAAIMGMITLRRPEGGQPASAPTEQELQDLLFCLEGRQVRQIQRHRLRQERPDHRRRRRPDEPRRLRAHRRASRPSDDGPDRGRRRDGLRRLLPVPRRHRRRRRGRHHLRDPAGWLDARPGSDRRRRRSAAWPWCSPACATSVTEVGRTAERPHAPRGEAARDARRPMPRTPMRPQRRSHAERGNDQNRRVENRAAFSTAGPRTASPRRMQ